MTSIFIIGRGESSDIQIKEPSISRRHLEVCLIDNFIYIADLKTTNGTYLLTKQGFQRFDSGTVELTDKLALGDHVLSVQQLLELIHSQFTEIQQTA